VTLRSTSIAVPRAIVPLPNQEVCDENTGRGVVSRLAAVPIREAETVGEQTREDGLRALIKEKAMRRFTPSLFAVMMMLAVFGVSPSANAQSEDPDPMLKMATLEAGSPGMVRQLARTGVDIAAVRQGPVVESEPGVFVQTYLVEAVLSSRDEERLARAGLRWSEIPGKGPTKKIGEIYSVYQSFDAPVTGIRAQVSGPISQSENSALMSSIRRF